MILIESIFWGGILVFLLSYLSQSDKIAIERERLQQLNYWSGLHAADISVAEDDTPCSQRHHLYQWIALLPIQTIKQTLCGEANIQHQIYYYESALRQTSTLRVAIASWVVLQEFEKVGEDAIKLPTP